MNLHFNKYGNEDLSHSGAADSRRMCLVSSTVANKATTQKCFAHTPKKFVMNVVDIKMVCVPMQVVVLIFVLWCLQKISALEPVQRAFKLARCIHVVVTNMQSVMNGAVVVCNRALTRLLITVLPSMKMIFYVRDERKPNLMMIMIRRNLKILIRTDMALKRVTTSSWLRILLAVLVMTLASSPSLAAAARTPRAESETLGANDSPSHGHHVLGRDMPGRPLEIQRAHSIRFQQRTASSNANGLRTAASVDDLNVRQVIVKTSETGRDPTCRPALASLIFPGN